MEDQLRPSTSITEPELSDAKVITTMPLILETPGVTVMEPPVNGISSSDLMELTSTTREERFLMSRAQLIKKDNM